MQLSPKRASWIFKVQGNLSLGFARTLLIPSAPQQQTPTSLHSPPVPLQLRLSSVPHSSPACSPGIAVLVHSASALQFCSAVPSGENDISEYLCPKLNVSQMLKWKKYYGESACLAVEINYVQWRVMALGTTYDPRTPFREVITTPLDLSDNDGGTLIPRKQITISNRKLPTSNFFRVTSSH